MHKTEEGWKKRRVTTVKNCAKGDRKQLVKQKKKKKRRFENGKTNVRAPQETNLTHKSSRT